MCGYAELSHSHTLFLYPYYKNSSIMNEIELKEKVYEGVLMLAVSLVRQNKTMTSSEQTDWINKNYPGFEHPYGNSRGVPKATFRRAKDTSNREAMDALVKAFTHNDGTPLWQE